MRVPFFRLSFPSLLVLAALAVAPRLSAQTDSDAADRETRHLAADWTLIAPHLPDPYTGAPAALETAGDVLRARRLPEDALDYYRFAMDRGGKPRELFDRIGVTDLELRRPNAAKAAFQRALSIDRKSAISWNNLGASEYVLGNFRAAVLDYKKAVQLSKKTAIFHSNLGTAYFDLKDYDSAQREFATAVKIDPAVFHHGGWGGVEAHVLSPQDRGRFCFEMAKLAARQHDDESVLHWLAMAGETGYDISWELKQSKELEPYLHDERVATLMKNAKAMRSRQIASSTPVPAMAAESPKNN